MGVVTVSKDVSGRITVAFHYNPQLVEKIKTIEGRKWNPEEKNWSFPDTDGTLAKILKVFEGEEIHIEPFLQVTIKGSPRFTNGAKWSFLTCNCDSDRRSGEAISTSVWDRFQIGTLRETKSNRKIRKPLDTLELAKVGVE